MNHLKYWYLQRKYKSLQKKVDKLTQARDNYFDSGMSIWTTAENNKVPVKEMLEAYLGAWTYLSKAEKMCGEIDRVLNKMTDITNQCEELINA